MVLSFQFGAEFFGQPWFVAIFMIGVGLLMVSQLPTYSFKRVRVPRAMALPLMIVVGLLAGFLVTNPWSTLSVLGLVYLATIPLAWRSYHRLKAKTRQEDLERLEAMEDGGADDPFGAPEGVDADGASGTDRMNPGRGS